VLVACAALVTPAWAETPEEAKQAAIAAAESWLGMTDANDAAGSWQAAATLFQSAATEDQWTQALSGARAPLGAVRSRTLQSAQPATSLPGAPDGEYVVLQYSTSFEHKQAATETVTPMRQPDGSWRVAGYFIK
jgi:hypothetical protein